MDRCVQVLDRGPPALRLGKRLGHQGTRYHLYQLACKYLSNP